MLAQNDEEGRDEIVEFGDMDRVTGSPYGRPQQRPWAQRGGRQRLRRGCSAADVDELEVVAAAIPVDRRVGAAAGRWRPPTAVAPSMV